VRHTKIRAAVGAATAVASVARQHLDQVHAGTTRSFIHWFRIITTTRRDKAHSRKLYIHLLSVGRDINSGNQSLPAVSGWAGIGTVTCSSNNE